MTATHAQAKKVIISTKAMLLMLYGHCYMPLHKAKRTLKLCNGKKYSKRFVLYLTVLIE